MPQANAAVAVVHTHGEHESVLLIRRTERADDPWSGHWSFPGGRREPDDEDLIETALRELAEECGIVLGRESLEACLPPAPAGRRVGRVMTVAPFLFRAASELPTQLDPEEAAESVWIPLSLLRDPARHCLTCVPRLPREWIFPAIHLNGVPLWGFTYRVLSEWLRLHPPAPAPDKAAFQAAQLLLDFLLASGMELSHRWVEQGATKVAAVKGEIPVAEVLSHLAVPDDKIPPVSSLEIHPHSLKVVGLDSEEYVIEAK
jgi:8-oxo-dGTP pyrophosphatase MutT (NUDIX family)